VKSGLRGGWWGQSKGGLRADVVDVHPSLHATALACVITTCAKPSISMDSYSGFVAQQSALFQAGFLSAVQVVDFVSIRKLDCSQKQVCV
jgi:hypothetical protein